jgi:hypothetical protein
MVETDNNCGRCRELEQRVEAQKRRGDAAEAAYQDQDRELRRQRAAVRLLQAELAKTREDEDGAGEIKDLLRKWQILCNHQRAKIPLDGARAKAVRRARAMKFTAEQIERAFIGAGKWAYVGPHGRKQTGEQRERFDDVTLILRDEATIERFIAYADREHDPKATPDNVVPLRSGRAAREAEAKLEVTGDMLNEALRQVAELRRVVEIQQDMIALEANLNERLLAELADGREEAAA